MRTRLTYSNVVATLALFVALGGSSYAAIKITGKQIKDGSVTTADVKNRSLLAKDFKAGQLKAGPRGAAGPTGATGTAGAAGAAGKDGAPGAAGADGTAKAFGYVSTGGTVAFAKNMTTANVSKSGIVGEYCINGLAFTPQNAQVHPDVLSGGSVMHAEVQVPSDNTGGCGGAQVYIRISQLSVSGGNLSSTGMYHGFYIELN